MYIHFTSDKDIRNRVVKLKPLSLKKLSLYRPAKLAATNQLNH